MLIHTDEYYPTCAACAFRMQVFADVLLERGNEVVIITGSTNQANGAAENRRERILSAPAYRMRKKTAITRMLNNLSFAITSVVASLFAGKVDVVITTSPPPLISISGWLIARLKRAKLVYDVRDIWPEIAVEMGSIPQSGLYFRLFRMITDFMYRRADMITTVSPGKVEKIKNRLAVLARGDTDKVRLIANGFDREGLAGETDMALVKQYQLEEKFTCVYIGNIGLAQGLDMLLDLAGQVEDDRVQFLLFGSGAEKERLERRTENGKLDNIRFCGVLPHDKVYTILKKAKLSFIPLKSANMKDSIPTKLYDALGLGCPVLLIAEGDAPKILEESGLGRCISPSRIELLPEVFREAMEQYDSMLLNREKTIRIMQDRYSRQQFALLLEQQLRELMTRGEKREIAKW